MGHRFFFWDYGTQILQPRISRIFTDYCNHEFREFHEGVHGEFVSFVELVVATTNLSNFTDFATTNCANFTNYSNGSVDDAFELEGWGTEVDNDGQAKAACRQIIMSLGFMDFVKFFDGFQFKDDLSFYYEIGFEFADLFAQVEDGQAFLALEGDAAFG